MSQLARRDLQVARGERQRAAIDRFAHGGQHVALAQRQFAAEDDERRVEQAHRDGDRFADQAAGGLQQLDRVAHALLRQRGDVAHVVGLVAACREIAADRPARGVGLQAAGVAAAAVLGVFGFDIADE